VPSVATKPDRCDDVRRALLVEGLGHASSFNPAGRIVRGTAQVKKTTEEEEVGRVNNDAVFEFACRFIVMKSLPGWIDEICTEHLQSVQPVSVPGDRAFLAGAPLVSLLLIGDPTNLPIPLFQPMRKS